MKLVAEHLGGARGTADTTCFHGTAFGITVSTAFPIPGVANDPGHVRNPDTRVADCTQAEFARIWPRGTGTVLDEIRQRSGRLLFRLTFDPHRGYLFKVDRFGSYLVATDGSEVLCVPPQTRPWFWERFLTARALPFATVLRAHEALHASAVSLAGRGLAFLGDRGQGKTSIAVHLALRGATILTDDVLALERKGQDVIGHPGAALISLRRNEFELLSADERRLLGTPLGDGAKIYVAPHDRARRLPLSAVYFVVRGAAGDDVRLEYLSRPDPCELLAASFVTFVRTADRLTRQLDTCAALALGVPTFRIHTPAHISARAVAAAVSAHAAALPQAGSG